MNNAFSKVSTLIVLIAVALAFAGLPGFVSAGTGEKVEKSCCDECNNNEGRSADHCSTPDCPMFLCLSVNVVSVFTLSELSGSIHIPYLFEEVVHEFLLKPIFHPPVII
ncbi:MAG: hypothetical protein EPN22_00255 [Nitrospirae bacterium]|nr:MAG: hypothetical protein EPN22_00255 [Nitrospirota bacterium]